MAEKSKLRKRAKVWFWGLLTGALIGALIYSAVIWQIPMSNSRAYEAQWRPQIEAKAARDARIETIKRAGKPLSVEPIAPGFKEKDIEKQEGKRFKVH